MIEGKTANITIRSIVGRFLEHARIYVFGSDDPVIYISSADMMTRNTEKRVEIAAPIKEIRLKKDILAYLELQMKDNVKARLIDQDGNLYKIESTDEKIDSQDIMMQRAIEEAPKKVEETPKDNKGFFDLIRDFLSKHR